MPHRVRATQRGQKLKKHPRFKGRGGYECYREQSTGLSQSFSFYFLLLFSHLLFKQPSYNGKYLFVHPSEFQGEIRFFGADYSLTFKQFIHRLCLKDHLTSEEKFFILSVVILDRQLIFFIIQFNTYYIPFFSHAGYKRLI